MKKLAICSISILSMLAIARAQPEFYSDTFLGLPEFRALPVRLPTAHPDSVQLQVHVRIVHDDLQFVRNDDGYVARYGLDVSLRDEKDRLVSSQHTERTLTAGTYAETNSRTASDQTKSAFTLVPGTYNLRIDLIDRETRKTRVIEKEIDFTADKWRTNFKLGEIVLIDSTGYAHLNSGILQRLPLRAAFMLYCKDISDLAFFYQLQDEHERLYAKQVIELEGEAGLYADTLEIQLDSLRHGTYQLILAARCQGTTLTRGYPFNLLQQNLPGYIHNLELAIRQLKYVASDDEYRQLTKAHPSKRETLFRAFWEKKDPTPATPTNEKMEEYYRRIRFADEQFTGYRSGWESDMGKVYIIYGPPSDIERHPFDISTKPYEIWYYYDINRKFVFQDQEGFGDYRLISPLWSDY